MDLRAIGMGLIFALMWSSAFATARVIVADVLLPDDFEPSGRDGEVEEFLCLAAGDVQAALDAGEFTVEAGLAMQEFLDRRAAEAHRP